jgi:predicted nucleic acid-binding protein
MIVLDASAAIELLRRSAVGRLIARRLRSPDEVIHVPHFMSVEVCQVLRRLARTGTVAPERAREALADLERLATVRHGHELLLSRMWELRDTLTAYDAAYVALAEAIGATLITCDVKLAQAPGHEAEIELVR